MDGTIAFYKFKCNWGVWEQKIKYTLTVTGTSFQYNNGKLDIRFVTHCFHFDYIYFIIRYFWSKNSLKKKVVEIIHNEKKKLIYKLINLFDKQSMFSPKNMRTVIGIWFYIRIPHFGSLSLIQSNSCKLLGYIYYYCYTKKYFKAIPLHSIKFSIID